MAEGKASAVKTLIAPALISLVLFLTITYLLLPAYRRYRARYAQYLPLDTLHSHTSSLRGRIPNPVAAWQRWRGARGERAEVVDGRDSADINEDGEELSDVDEQLWHAMQGHAQGTRTAEHTRRLSRDLEEGFRDDSDDDDEGRRPS